MKTEEINIRDPFVVYEDGIYYLYGTRAKDFGRYVGGVDVYTSTDLSSWSEPHECFNSVEYGMNREVNWAPEVHRYKGRYYMLATFTRENGRRGTYALVSDSLMGPFVPHGETALTPEEWECLDGSLYIAKDGKPYLVFCHEHTQIIDGTMCYAELKEDLTGLAGEPVTLFTASSPYYVDKKPEGEHYITDGPFMYRTKTDELFMLWSTHLGGKYAECLVKFGGGEIGMDFEHVEPLITNDGGHGMIFRGGDELFLTYHTPNTKGKEHPAFKKLIDCGDSLKVEEI